MKTSTEIRAEARKALSENGQYLRYVGAYLLLMLITVIVSIPLMGILGVGIGISGIAPFFAPGGYPELELFLDPSVMVPLLISVLVFSLLVIYPLGYVTWGQSAMAIATMRRGLTFGHSLSGWGHGWRMGVDYCGKVHLHQPLGVTFICPWYCKTHLIRNDGFHCS